MSTRQATDTESERQEMGPTHDSATSGASGTSHPADSTASSTTLPSQHKEIPNEESDTPRCVTFQQQCKGTCKPNCMRCKIDDRLQWLVEPGQECKETVMLTDEDYIELQIRRAQTCNKSQKRIRIADGDTCSSSESDINDDESDASSLSANSGSLASEDKMEQSRRVVELFDDLMDNISGIFQFVEETRDSRDWVHSTNHSAVCACDFILVTMLGNTSLSKKLHEKLAMEEDRAAFEKPEVPDAKAAFQQPDFPDVTTSPTSPHAIQVTN